MPVVAHAPARSAEDHGDRGGAPLVQADEARAARRRDRAAGSAAGRAARRCRRSSRPGRRACRGRCGGRRRTPSVGLGGRWMSYSSGRSQRAGSRLAAPRHRCSTEPAGHRARRRSSVSSVTQRENIGSVGIHRTDSSMAGRSSVPVVAHRVEHVGPLEQRGERDAHLLPRRARAGREQQHRRTSRISASVSRCVTPSSSVSSASTSTLMRSSSRARAAGRDDRLEDRRRPRAGRAERLADVERLLDGDAEAAGDGEHRDGGAEVDVELGAPVVDERVDQRVDGLARSSSVDPPLRLRRHERRLDQRAVAAVLRAAHATACCSNTPSSRRRVDGSAACDANTSALR